jgi:formate/nitrite transporter FocA (FNT family)
VGAPEPEEIYERTRAEGKRRLERPLLELLATALAAGFDIAAGVAVLGLVESELEHHWGKHTAHVFGSVGFGIGFVFLVVGRGELFTENFLVPLAGLDHKEPHAWRKLAELWAVSPFTNVLAGGFIGVLLSVHSVLPYGAGASFVHTAQTLHENGWLALFVSAVFAGALITAMTWFVEGQENMMVRVVVAWIAGAILALGSFDHVIVATVEMVFGIRYGAPIPWSFVAENFFLAGGANLLGGVGLVTLIRFTQAHAGSGGAGTDRASG